MKALAQQLLGAFWRQRAIDTLSAAARPHEQRDLDRIAEVAEKTLQGSPEDPVAALAGRCLPYIERLLASQGDRADPALVALQHDLAAMVTAVSVKP